MEKVYVIESNNCEPPIDRSEWISGVFSTKEKAEALLQKWGCIKVFEDGWEEQFENGDMNQHCITEYVVDQESEVE